MGVDDVWASDAVDAVDRVFAVSHCSTQLVVIETPWAGKEEEEGEERSKEDGGSASSKTTTLWPLCFSIEDLNISH